MQRPEQPVSVTYSVLHSADNSQYRLSSPACSGSMIRLKSITNERWQSRNLFPLRQGQSSCPFGYFFWAKSRIKSKMTAQLTGRPTGARSSP